MRSGPAIALAAGVAVAAVFALRTALARDASRRNWELFPDMAYSVAVESQTLGERGPNQQPLVRGVVVRGRMPFRYGPGPEEAKRAGAELGNPFAPDDAEALLRGEFVYRTRCVVCHDPQGDGQGPATSRGMVPPPSLHGVRALEIADGEMFHVLTRGQGNMASYAAQLTESDRWRVILHVRALQRARVQGAHATEAQPTESAPPGEEVPK